MLLRSCQPKEAEEKTATLQLKSTNHERAQGPQGTPEGWSAQVSRCRCGLREKQLALVRAGDVMGTEFSTRAREIFLLPSPVRERCVKSDRTLLEDRCKESTPRASCWMRVANGRSQSSRR